MTDGTIYLVAAFLNGMFLDSCLVAYETREQALGRIRDERKRLVEAHRLSQNDFGCETIIVGIQIDNMGHASKTEDGAESFLCLEIEECYQVYKVQFHESTGK